MRAKKKAKYNWKELLSFSGNFFFIYYFFLFIIVVRSCLALVSFIHLHILYIHTIYLHADRFIVSLLHLNLSLDFRILIFIFTLQIPSGQRYI